MALVGPDRGRSPVRYVVEKLDDGRWRLGHLVGSTIHKNPADAMDWAEKMQGSGSAEFIMVDSAG